MPDPVLRTIAPTTTNRKVVTAALSAKRWNRLIGRSDCRAQAGPWADNGPLSWPRYRRVRDLSTYSGAACRPVHLWRLLCRSGRDALRDRRHHTDMGQPGRPRDRADRRVV